MNYTYLRKQIRSIKLTHSIFVAKYSRSKMKKGTISFTFSLLFLLLLHRAVAFKSLLATESDTPPRGWNSYDSFCWTVSEEEFLQNAELVSQRLHSHGYEYVVVDYLWYRRKVPGADTTSEGFDVIDEWGRMVPDPDRWPSSRDGKGFSEVASKVHSMGLKFGIHVMRGISTQAVNANTPILDSAKGGAYVEDGRNWTASDIGIQERRCAWMSKGFMSVNTKLGAGKAFLRSLYEQYAEWGVDFVKHDCVFGDDLDLDEITYVSEVLRELSHPVLYSLSPGTSVTPAMAKDVSGLVNMYRITGDDWDNWGDVASHFDVSRDFAAADMIGSSSVMGRSWPDLDMLPLGWLTDAGSADGPHRNTNLNIEEQKTQMTLWAMAKSPLMFGGDMRNLDDATYNLITNPTILEINAFSTNNTEYRFTGYAPKTNDNHHPHLTLVSCKETIATGWSTETLDQDLDRVCWKDMSTKHGAPFCLYKRKAGAISDQEVAYKTQYPGQTQLLASATAEVCLSASSKRRLTSKEFRRGSLSTCKRDANQMWELGTNGTLVNSYSGLCATVKANGANDSPGGIRSWVANGRNGELYFAFFNLNDAKTEVSAQLSDLPMVLPGVKAEASYNCTEIWSGQACQISGSSISVSIEPHGAALAVVKL